MDLDEYREQIRNRRAALLGLAIGAALTILAAWWLR